MSNDFIRKQGTLFGHPKALFLLFTTEMWERFSYYAMRAILVLYLVDQAKGLGWSNADAINLYGTFTMLVYLTPLFGGWLADAYLGQRKSIMIGGALMAAGQFTLAIPHAWFAGMEETVFYAGLGLLIAGNGLFKPNISTMVGDLYEDGDHRRDGAFTIFYMGINLGAFLSGILVGIIVAQFGSYGCETGQLLQQGGQYVCQLADATTTEASFFKDYQAGFFAAGIGMVLSLIVQAIFAQKLLGNIGLEAAQKKQKKTSSTHSNEPLTQVEWDRIKVILIMGVFTIIFWAGFEQAGGLMTIYTEKFTDRVMFGWEIPTTFFQSLNPAFIFIFAPAFAWLWTNLGDKEPNSPVKFGLGLFLLGFGFLFMIGAVLQQGGDPSVKTGMGWLVAAYFFHTMGELCLSPIGLSMVTKLAPLKLMSFFMGLWFFYTGLANKVAGVVGSLIGGGHGGDESEMVHNAIYIFGGIAITAAISAVIMWLLADKLVAWMHGAEGPISAKDTLKDELETAVEAP